MGISSITTLRLRARSYKRAFSRVLPSPADGRTPDPGPAPRADHGRRRRRETPSRPGGRPRPSASPSIPSTGFPTTPQLWAEAPLELMVRFVCVPIGREGAAPGPRLRRPRRPAEGGRGGVPPGPAHRGGGGAARARGAGPEAPPRRRRAPGAGQRVAAPAARGGRGGRRGGRADAARGEPHRPPGGLADPGRHRPPRLRRPHRDQGPRGAGQVPRSTACSTPRWSPWTSGTTRPSSAASRSCPSWTSRRSACPRTGASGCGSRGGPSTSASR